MNIHKFKRVPHCMGGILSDELPFYILVDFKRWHEGDEAWYWYTTKPNGYLGNKMGEIIFRVGRMFNRVGIIKTKNGPMLVPTRYALKNVQFFVQNTLKFSVYTDDELFKLHSIFLNSIPCLNKSC